ncbi:MAG TPA: acetyl-CoA hydrolase/transferase C-terminal domain-containing protein [Acidimicrobiales bacterium]|nr:acetyl-CoA hydrolase/transferase C-terminal domain-containing protein [Acidimicrobiales bacterium]
MNRQRSGKNTTVDEAIDAISDGSRIYVAQGSGCPYGLLTAIDQRRGSFRNLEFVSAFLLERPAPIDHLGDPFRWLSLQPTGVMRDVLDHEAFGIVPGRYSDLDGICGPGAPLAADAMICQVSPPDSSGMCSLGTGVGGHVSLINDAPLVIGQVNNHMPFVHGEGECHIEDFDFLVTIDEPLAELQPATIDPISSAIAEHISPFIPDGSTLQFGIGAVPDAVLSTLQGRKNLGLHGGMINNACVDLIKCGAVDNLHKGCDEGVSVAAEIMGTRELYDWVDHNPLIRMARGSHTHGIPGMASVRNFVALQSTVEMALDGSANSEFASGRFISGPGGAPDFAFGASIATGGRSIIAMPSTAAKGTASRIVRRLTEGAPTTLPSYVADVVVTEFGAVELRGRTLSERAELLVSIAHPDHQDLLCSP